VDRRIANSRHHGRPVYRDAGDSQHDCGGRWVELTLDSVGPAAVMKAIVIGGGTIGSAVKKALEEKGHAVVSVGRKSGDYQADISDPNSLKALFSKLAPSKP
jgi:hypothetical protein